jgi:hypothetical protein
MRVAPLLAFISANRDHIFRYSFVPLLREIRAAVDGWGYAEIVEETYPEPPPTTLSLIDLSRFLSSRFAATTADGVVSQLRAKPQISAKRKLPDAMG